MGELSFHNMGRANEADYAYFKQSVTAQITGNDINNDPRGTRVYFADSFEIIDLYNFSLIGYSELRFSNSYTTARTQLSMLVGKYYQNEPTSMYMHYGQGLSASGDLTTNVYSVLAGPKRYCLENSQKHATTKCEDGYMTGPVT